MSLQEKHVYEFSPDGKLLALINIDGRLLIWDTETNILRQSFTLSTKSNLNCTALTWILSSTTSKKDKRKSIDTTSSLFIAFGTSKGGVELYSFASGDVINSFKGAGHTGHINNISFDKKDTIYTCGADAHIIGWSIKKLHQVSVMKTGTDIPYSVVTTDDLIIAGGRQLKTWNKESNTIVHTFTGHSSNITIAHLINVEGVDYLVTGSTADRILSMWCLKNEQNQKRKSKGSSGCTASFLMEDVPISVSCCINSDGQLKISAVTRSGVVHYFVENFATLKTDKPIKPKVTVEVVADSTKVVAGIPSYYASVNLQKESSPDEILIGYGAKQFMAFESMKVDFAKKNQIEIRVDPRKIKKSTDTATGSKDINTVKPVIDPKRVEYISNDAVVTRKTAREIELPMETRLENLSVSTKDGPQMKNITQLLIQALHSKDASMLNLVFACKDIKTIEYTLQRLPPQYIDSLVDELSMLMQRKTLHVQKATKWMKALFLTQSSQLMALGTDELFSKFGPCIGMAETRINNMKSLSSVKGRLDLLVNQLKKKKISDDDHDGLNYTNVLVYQDKDSSDEDVNQDDDHENSSDENKWEEDDESDENKADENGEESDDDDESTDKIKLNGDAAGSEMDDDSEEESEMDVSD